MSNFLTASKNIFIMNSMGRCGSTALFKFAYNYHDRFEKTFYRPAKLIFANPRYPNEVRTRRSTFLTHISDRDKSLDKNNLIEVWKTHDRKAPSEKLENTRIVYQFADPRDVVMSTVYGKLNKYVHIKESLGVDISWFGTDRWLYEDVLRLEEHFDNWANQKSNDVLMIHYDSMWQRVEEILDFLKIPNSEADNFPRKKDRKYNWKDLSGPDSKMITKTYSSLIEKMRPFVKL